ncbi:DUF6712 family protein [Mucilaginibacter sp.]
MSQAPLTTHLVKDTPDVKKWFSGIDADYDISSLQSFIADAESDYLVPAFSQGLITALITAYNSGEEMSAGLTALLPYIQKAAVHFAMMLSSDSGGFRISDSGYYVKSTDTSKPVSDKKLTEFRKGRWQAAYKAVEQAITFLEENIAVGDYAPYATSPQHAAARKFFINDSVTFTNNYQKLNNSAVSFRALRDALGWAERTYILPLLGQPLNDDIKAGIAAGNLSEAYKTLLPYIQLPLALYTVNKGIPALPVEMDGINLVINSMPAFGNSENVRNQAAATPAQLGMLAMDACKDAVAELKRLQTFLIANYANYPLYVVPPVDEQGDININDHHSKIFFV